MSLAIPHTPERLVQIALAATEYPHKLDQELHQDADLRPPRQLNPSFYGSYDWHSSEHGHWLLVRALARGLTGEIRATVIAHLDEHLTSARLAGEYEFFAGPGGAMSERPYGWAWLGLLHAGCVVADEPRTADWAAALTPLATLLAERFRAYVTTSLAFPIRTGTHSNTAFSLDLALRAARLRGDRAGARELGDAARRLFGDGSGRGWSLSPAGDAFLSPPLSEAALLATVFASAELAAWLHRDDPSPIALATPSVLAGRRRSGTVHLEARSCLGPGA